MKKIILLAAFAVGTMYSYAQPSFGVQAGANFGMGHTKYTYVDPVYGSAAIANDPKVGALIGVLAEIPFGSIAFRPELNFVQEGSKTGASFAGYTGIGSRKITLNYIEVPLNVVYNLHLGGGSSKLFFGLGPQLNLGLSGKEKYTDTDDNGNPITVKTDVKFDGKKDKDITDPADNNTHLKRVDVGINILAGYQLPMGLFAKVGYSMGFMNIDPNKDEAGKPSYKNRSVSLVVGYMFGGKMAKKK